MNTATKHKEIYNKDGWIDCIWNELCLDGSVADVRNENVFQTRTGLSFTFIKVKWQGWVKHTGDLCIPEWLHAPVDYTQELI